MTIARWHPPDPAGSAGASGSILGMLGVSWHRPDRGSMEGEVMKKLGDRGI